MTLLGQRIHVELGGHTECEDRLEILGIAGGIEHSALTFIGVVAGVCVKLAVARRGPAQLDLAVAGSNEQIRGLVAAPSATAVMLCTCCTSRRP